MDQWLAANWPKKCSNFKLINQKQAQLRPCAIKKPIQLAAHCVCVCLFVNSIWLSLPNEQKMVVC